VVILVLPTSIVQYHCILAYLTGLFWTALTAGMSNGFTAAEVYRGICLDNSLTTFIAATHDEQGQTS
jgi:hypothetical protein